MGCPPIPKYGGRRPCYIIRPQKYNIILNKPQNRETLTFFFAKSLVRPDLYH